MKRNGSKHECYDPTETESLPEDDPELFAGGAPHGLRRLCAEQPQCHQAERA